jgi:carbon-monoxide dehydrogenase large subunit
LIGDSPLRKEDLRLLTGKGSFTIDTKLPGELYLLRTQPYARARITSRKVHNADDTFYVFFDDGLKKDLPMISIWPGTPAPSFPLLARGEVFYAGQLVAAAVASSRALVEDASESIDIEYEELPVILDGEAAVRSEAATLRSDFQTKGSAGYPKILEPKCV